MPVRTLVIQRPGQQEQVGRTLRALRAAGADADHAGTDLAGAIAGADGPVWLVRAGAWPAHPGPVLTPPPSATGRPLVALGAVLGEPGVEPDGLASVYLDVEPA